METAFLFNLILRAPVLFALVYASVYELIFVRFVVLERIFGDLRAGLIEPKHKL